jgi:ABC-type dipeptide/oligopeptide/nickel transport system permease component
MFLHLDFGPSMWKFDRTVNDIIFGRCYLRNVLRERLLTTYGVEAYSMTFSEPPGLFDSSALIIETNGEMVGSIDITWRDRFEAIGTFLVSAPVMMSAQLGLFSMFIAVIIGIPLGVISAIRPNTWIDYGSMVLSMLGVSVPSFVLGIVLILIFALRLEMLPTYGWGESWKQMVLPIVTLSTGGWPLIARLTRASMLEVIRADYVRTARAKGLREWIVMVRHALRNALIPIITVMGPVLGTWITGSFLVESIFSIGGIGRYFVTAVYARDYPLLLGIIFIYAAVMIAMNLLVDVAYALVDPRLRFQ